METENYRQYVLGYALWFYEDDPFRLSLRSETPTYPFPVEPYPVSKRYFTNFRTSNYCSSSLSALRNNRTERNGNGRKSAGPVHYIVFPHGFLLRVSQSRHGH